MIRRVGESVRIDRTYRVRPGAYVILRLGGSLLLTHQVQPEPEFQLPGGGIDPGEQVLPALHREVYEETGWTMSRPTRLGVFRRFTYMPEYDLWAEKICRVYIARPARQLGPPSEPGHTAHWMPISLAAELLANEGDRMFVRRLVA